MPVILRWISGDQIQVQVLEMAVQELKPDAEPPALDSPVTWPNFATRFVCSWFSSFRAVVDPCCMLGE